LEFFIFFSLYLNYLDVMHLSRGNVLHLFYSSQNLTGKKATNQLSFDFSHSNKFGSSNFSFFVLKYME